MSPTPNDPRRPEPPKPGGKGTPRFSLPTGVARPAPAAPAAAPGEDLLGQTARLMAAVFNEQTQETTSLQVVIKALDRPGSKVVLELPWYPDGGRHELVLKGRSGHRMAFYNPLGNGGKPAGSELTDGLRRRVEPDGSESCDLADLEALFRLGKARALISPPL